jgi:hypothetical protein
MCPKSFQACAGALAIASKARAAGAVIFMQAASVREISSGCRVIWRGRLLL